MKKTILAILLVMASLSMQARTMRVLAIGNSFSQDAVEQNLYELAMASGDTLIIGNAYIGGCSIARHVENLHTSAAAYSYRKVVDGEKVTKEPVSLNEIIKDEPWDVISLQQASHDSGIKSTYALLPELKTEVERLMPVSDARVVWHQTWSYAADATHEAFPRYQNSQRVMNDSISAAVKSELPKVGLVEIVPAGPAIQKARAVFGDTLNADGYHLSHGLGRYVAACTWCEFLTGKSVVGNPYHPASISDADARKAQKAAHAAF